MNTTNANQTLGFDRFSESDYNLHWSFSNFNRMLMAAGQIAQLPLNSKVLELGAGTSELENLVKKNFRRKDIKFFKVDGDEQYKTDKSITVLDITSIDCDIYCNLCGKFDAIVLMEVIEHIDYSKVRNLLESIYGWLKPEGMLILTTPTPPYECEYEDRVWPTDHKFEFTLSEIYGAVNRHFKVVKEIGWSLEEREYNKLLESDAALSIISSKLRRAFPESYIRAIIACLSPVEANRQVLLVCKKRRTIARGRFTQT